MGQVGYSDSFICATCGETHRGIPALFSAAPHHYNQLSADERAASFLNEDICVILQQDFFVRGTLEIPVHGQDEPYTLGLWVSLSKPNFDRYIETFDDSPDEGPFFGWLCNVIPGYPDTLLLKTNVFFRSGGIRPRIELQPTDHPLASAQRDGISMDALRQLIEANLHRGNAPGATL